MHKSAAEFLASGDIAGLLAHNRARFGDLRMEDPPTPPAPPADPPADDKKFSQADMNATVARETTAAKTRAEADLAAALGVSVDEAKQIITDRKAADESKKSEAEKAADAAKTAQADAEKLKGEADRERHEAKVERALGRAGVDVENAAMLRAAMAAVEVTVGADADAIKAAVEKAKTDAPALFGATSGGGGTHSDTGGQGAGKKPVPAGDFGKAGAAEAARRWGTEKTA